MLSEFIEQCGEVNLRSCILTVLQEHTEAVINNSHNFFDVFQIKYAYALTVSPIN